ncbi:MAG: type IV pilus secretin PilQ [Candidatus Adiutrix sp.]|jgi:type IV pilus assembly protein PilQ|nr:type IV pilus secretin PilQ [Candidatus Adiutrix sp.]
MTGSLKRASILLALAAAAWLGLAGPARAGGSLVALQGGFAPTGQEAGSSAPTSAPAPAPPSAVGAVDLNETPRAAHYDAPRAYTGERISLDFQNADLHNIIRIIGEVSGKNIVVSDKVVGKVTLKLKDVPWDQALDIVLASRNLGVEEAGNVLTVYDLQTLNGIRADRDRLAAERMAAAIQAPLAKKVFTPKYAPIGVVADELKKLATARGKIVAIGNDIYVEDEPGSINTMTQIFLRVDRISRQILIEARIIEADASLTNRLGVDWGIEYSPKYQDTGAHKFTQTPGNAGYFDDGTLVERGSGGGAADFSNGISRLGFGYLNKAGSLLLNARINASETTSETRTISAPRIMASNDQSVSIKQGYQIPYQSGGSATTASNTEFKEAVMELKVTPHIEENGQIVTLEIDLKHDAPIDVNNNGGAISTSQAQTKLMVKDGDTVVIGGILSDRTETGSNRVPGLHRLPLLGWLFQNNTVGNDKKEMLIFITANIIPITI